jgi:hypothetical protein
MAKETKSIRHEELEPEKFPVEVTHTDVELGEGEDPAYERRLIEYWNELVKNDEERARQRYGGLFGKMRRFFDQEVRRVKAVEIEDVGKYKKRTWAKYLKIGLKMAGGAGATTAMVMTGGFAGMAWLNPTLFGTALREGIDGTIELAQRLGWGHKRASLEFAAHEQLRQSFQQAAHEIRTPSGEQYANRGEQAAGMTVDRFNELMAQIKSAEDQILATQARNLKA